MHPAVKARYFIQNQLRLMSEFAGDQWFDRTRNVQTSGEVTLREAGVRAGEQGDSEAYQPARPSHIRAALREMHLPDVSDYHFIDFGSGKGRTLLVAAEWPFQSITGVEFSPVLHAQAVANLERFRPGKHGCQHLASLHGNAMDYIFPQGKMVIYMFNPFGRATMQEVLRRLQDSLDCNPRHTVIILLWPQCQDQVAAMPGMRLTHRTIRHQIFEAHAA